MRFATCLSITCCFAGSIACAHDAFKCLSADGAVSFQDRPCAPGARQQRIVIPEVADAPLADAPQPDRVSARSPTVDVAPASAPLAPPGFILCTRDDGTRYRNESGKPVVRLVPVEIARPTPHGIGGGHRSGPVVGSGAYTQVSDECHTAAPDEACRFLRDELKEAEEKIRHTFRDKDAQKAADDLRAQLRGC